MHQNINDGVVADLDVATNLTLDRLSGKGAPLLFNPGRVRREAKAVADRMGLAIDLKARISDLSLADRQMVAIARAMAHQPKVLILDEPTSSLSSAEADRLFALLDRLREQGVAILYISHRMSDIRRLADRIVSMRDGVISGVFDKKPLDYEGAVNAMLGRKIHLDQIVARNSAKRGPDRRRPAHRARRQADLADARRWRGRCHHRPRRRRQDGTCRDAVRRAQAAVRHHDVERQALCACDRRARRSPPACSSSPRTVAKTASSAASTSRKTSACRSTSGCRALPFSSAGLERATARRQIEELGIVCRSEKDEMTTLSGGNQQKVMVARWMAQDARLFILDEPFQGVDISARRDIAAKLRASANGRATLLFVTELDEALETADRILVMSEQTIVGEHRNADVDLDRLLAEVAGGPLHSAA